MFNFDEKKLAKAINDYLSDSNDSVANMAVQLGVSPATIYRAKRVPQDRPISFTLFLTICHYIGEEPESFKVVEVRSKAGAKSNLTAHWEVDNDGFIYCSGCRRDDEEQTKPSICPHCGAKMVSNDPPAEQSKRIVVGERMPANVLMSIQCNECGSRHIRLVPTGTKSVDCRCGATIKLDNLRRADFVCPHCGKRTWIMTNIKTDEFSFPCRCGRYVDLKWNDKSLAYEKK